MPQALQHSARRLGRLNAVIADRSTSRVMRQNSNPQGARVARERLGIRNRRHRCNDRVANARTGNGIEQSCGVAHRVGNRKLHTEACF